MTAPKCAADDRVILPLDEFKELMRSAAEEGANQALAKLGLGDKDAAEELREARNLVRTLAGVRKQMLTTATIAITMLVIGIFGGGLLEWAKKALTGGH
ncbi:DUF6127 family protein [Chromobacterium rhizoryzae]|uniref:DUF6127 family protein n=1 Tax=Chromobacterium rhizoryzae TaxID=1778675 RepID=UPI001D079F76|nr:DUF6127 family protein [Chromobacterium rhizoryzae]